MTRLWFSGAALAVMAVGLWRFSKQTENREVPFEPPSRILEPAPLCPWRDPEGDLQRFFPGARRWRAETRILSGKRTEIEKQLGRPMAPEENALQLRCVYREAELAGMILTRRAKGEHGAIEIVLAANPDQSVRGVRLQSLREPPEVATALNSERWLGAFIGRAVSKDWNGLDGFPELIPAAQASAAAIVDAVRSALVLLAAAEDTVQPIPSRHH